MFEIHTLITKHKDAVSLKGLVNDVTALVTQKLKEQASNVEPAGWVVGSTFSKSKDRLSNLSGVDAYLKPYPVYYSASMPFVGTLQVGDLRKFEGGYLPCTDPDISRYAASYYYDIIPKNDKFVVLPVSEVKLLTGDGMDKIVVTLDVEGFNVLDCPPTFFIAVPPLRGVEFIENVLKIKSYVTVNLRV